MNIIDRYIKAIDDYAVPGLPQNLIVVFDKKGRMHTTEGIKETNEEIESYVNTKLAPMILMNAIQASRIEHGNSIFGRSYPDVEEVKDLAQDDYDFNIPLINYVEAIMVAASNYADGSQEGITVILYCAEAEELEINTYKDKEMMELYVKDDLEYLEN